MPVGTSHLPTLNLGIISGAQNGALLDWVVSPQKNWAGRVGYSGFPHASVHLQEEGVGGEVARVRAGLHEEAADHVAAGQASNKKKYPTDNTLLVNFRLSFRRRNFRR